MKPLGCEESLGVTEYEKIKHYEGGKIIKEHQLFYIS